MRPSFLLTLGILFLGLALVGPIYLFIREKTDGPTSSLIKVPLESGFLIPLVGPSNYYLIESEWPTRVEVSQSATIRISLITEDSGYTPEVEIQGNRALIYTPVPAGTPGTTLESAFGEEYVADAVAHLAGSSFDTEFASLSERQSLDQSRIDWIWNIRSDDPGLQSLDVSIEIVWEHVGQIEEPRSRQIWRAHYPIEIFQPVISRGQINIFSLFSGFLGSGLSIPWLYEMLGKRKSQRGKKTQKRA